MSPIVEPVPDALLFDTITPCSLATLQALKAIGFQGGIRSVTMDDAADPSDLTAEEVDNFMAAGLGLMLYQRVRNRGWVPSAALGAADALVAIRKATRATYLVGASVWDDLEGIGGDAASTIAYANAKAGAVRVAKYPPGEYVGYEVPLSGDQLFHDLSSSAYWRSGSNVPDVSVRGYVLEQVAMDVVAAGIKIDVNLARADRLGGRAVWMRAA